MTIPLAAEKIGQIGPLPITNTLIVSWIIVAFLCIIGYLSGKKAKMVPRGLQNIVEAILEPLYTITEDLAHSKTAVFFPIVATFFIYILAANIFGLLPGFGTIGFYEKRIEAPVTEHIKPVAKQETPSLDVHEEAGKSGEAAKTPEVEQPTAPQELQPKALVHKEEVEFIPIFRSLNADLNMTLGLGFLSILITHIFAIRYLGVGGYLRKWFSFNPIFLFVGLLELVGEFTKMVSLSLRLFGNIFAGEVVLTTVSNLLAFVAPLPFYFLEMIVAVVQAAVFMLLTLVFMVLLSEKHAEH